MARAPRRRRGRVPRARQRHRDRARRGRRHRRLGRHRLRYDGLWRPLKLFARRPLLSHVYHFPKNRGESKLGRVIGSGRSMASVLYRVVSRFAPNSAGPTTRHPGGAEASVGGKVLREYSTQPARRRRDPQARLPHSTDEKMRQRRAAPRRRGCPTQER